MKKNKNMLIVLGTIVFFFVLDALGVFRKFESRVFDLLLNIRTSPNESSNILLVEADNIALENIGTWPWKRDVYANMLMRMKELGATTAVFDIEFLSPSNFPESDLEFARAIQFFGNTFLTINTADLDINYTPEELDYTQSRFLYNSTGDTKALIEGNQKTTYETQKDNLFGYRKIVWSNPNVKNEFSIGFSPAMNMFMKRANGAGFTNTIIDSDGTRRRIELLKYQNDYAKSVGQLIFSPLVEQSQPQEIIRTRNKLILKNVSLTESDGNLEDIKIPLDREGRMIINWAHKKYQDSFRHESILFLDTLDKTEKNIFAAIQNILLESSAIFDTLNSLEESKKNTNLQNELEPIEQIQIEIYQLVQQYFDILNYKNYLLEICEGYDKEGNAINGGIAEEMYDEYFLIRKNFFDEVQLYANSDVSEKIQEWLFEKRDNFGEEKYVEYATTLGNLFEVLQSDTNLYNDLFQEKSASYKNAFCIIGNTASSTTDLGTTPFERAYPNIGTHANVLNTIINRDFIIPINYIWGILVTTILIIAQKALTKKKKSSVQNGTSILIIFFVILIPILLMKFFGIYVPLVTPFLIAFVTYLEVTILQFIIAEKDKKFLQTTFGTYVAPTIVEQIVKHPEFASLGGKSENLTALFSDVKTFSSFTEVINNEYGDTKGAEKLVEILNEYLGDLSNAIMSNRGTIDKYVGDEIVSFFGAPIPSENNAFDACVAAVKMLQAEKDFNEKNKDKLPINPHTNEPFYLHSRIGLNTGMMVVGNMGTEKKLNYTIMGNNVNLASRLEGTNKIYGSWIIASESTWRKANSGEKKDLLVARKFDCVRVVNVNKPVGIYNILGLKKELSANQIEAADFFNRGMELYLQGSNTPRIKKDIAQLKAAMAFFIKANSIYPEDESSKTFIERCQEFIKNGVPEIWDGVFTMQHK